MDLGPIKELALGALQTFSYSSAVFFANKLTSADPYNLENVYLLCEAFFGLGQYKRIIHYLEPFLPKATLNGSFELPSDYKIQDPKSESYLKCVYIAAKSYNKLSEWHNCLDLLKAHDFACNILINNSTHPNSSTPSHKTQTKQDPSSKKTSSNNKQGHFTALLCFLRAEAFESLDIRLSAAEWYKNALTEDVYCFEAWERITDHHLLSPEDESLLLNSLHFDPGLEWLKSIYSGKTSAFEHGAYNQTELNTGNVNISSILVKQALQDLQVLPTKLNLLENEDILQHKAAAAFYANQYTEAFYYTNRVLKNDPFSTNILPTHIACMVELKLKNELFVLAHKLAENSPKSAISWYAVASYYFLIGSWPDARRYFGKSTSISREFGHAWLGYGHTFAIEGEHDQALASYRTAARLLIGSHLPILAIAAELTHTNNLNLAIEYALKAKEIQPMDPHTWHELGVIHYRNGHMVKAAECFETVLSLIGTNINDTWESTLYNLGHVYRKLNRLDDSIRAFEKALLAIPFNSTTYSALGVVLHLKGDLNKAIEYYHKALDIDSDDTFTSDLLSEAIKEQYSHIASQFN